MSNTDNKELSILISRLIDLLEIDLRENLLKSIEDDKMVTSNKTVNQIKYKEELVEKLQQAIKFAYIIWGNVQLED